MEPYKTESKLILKDLLLSPSEGWPVWTVSGAGLVMTAVGVCVDIRWCVAGLMICIAVVPCIIAFIYFMYILSPDVVANMLPHTLEHCEDGYLLRIWRRADPADTADPDQWIETGTVRLDDSNITRRKTSFEYETLYFRDSCMKILYVPRFKK